VQIAGDVSILARWRVEEAVGREVDWADYAAVA
jgi:hypothetical protein